MPTKDEVLRVRIPSDMMAQAKALAKKEDVPLSQIVRKLLKEKLDEEAVKVKQSKGDKKP